VECLELLLVLEQLHSHAFTFAGVDDAITADRHLVVLVHEPVRHDVLVLEFGRESGRVREFEFEVRVRLQCMDELHNAD